MFKAAALCVVFACSAPVAHTPHPSSTRLVVLLVIDQWPEWAFEQKRANLSAGFAKLLAEGEWTVGHYPSAATLTAPGHTLLGTGEPPATSGILANEWWHRDLGRVVNSVEGADGARSATWLRVPGLGDSIAAAHSGAKAVAISLKDRAAILPLGHSGIAIWYDPKTARFTSRQPLAWLDAWNPVPAHLHDVWTPLDPRQLATLSGVPDAQPGEVGEKGFGATFPHDLGATKSPADAIFGAPIGNELVLDTAMAAITGEQLGTDDAPDLLVLSLSAHDYVGHGWGHESWEAWDMTLRLDQRLAQFLDDLDRAVGTGRWAMIVTSDHGASALPERSSGGRLTHEQIQIAANNAASAVLGQGTWIDNAHYPALYFSKAALAQPKGELESATKRVINALRSFPGLERVGRVADVAGHCERRPEVERAICLTFDPERSGDVFFLPAAGWIIESEDEPTATAHGSLHDSDRNVPVIAIASGHKTHAPQTEPRPGFTPMTDIAPLLARWLSVPAPAQLPR